MCCVHAKVIEGMRGHILTALCLTLVRS